MVNLSIKLIQILIIISVSTMLSQSKNYKVKKITDEIVITGLGSDELWEQANLLTDFTYPWRDEEAPVTEFRSLWSDTYFYFLFKVKDKRIITSQRGLGEDDVVKSDRVEIFFKPDNKKNPYYSLEMDALGRLLDSEGVFGKYINIGWNWPQDQIGIKASHQSGSYIVEGSISLISLKKLGLYKGSGVINAGLYRGEYFIKPNKEIGVKWISWVIPDSKNFHIPSSFGVLELLE